MRKALEDSPVGASPTPGMSKDKLAAKTFSSMVVTGISKLLGFLRTAIFAAIYGATIQTDAFFMSVNIFSLAGGIMESLAAVVVPLRTSQLNEAGRKEADDTCSVLLNLSLILSLAFAIFLFFTAPFLVKLFAPYFEGEAYTLTVRICRICVPIVVFASYTYFAAGILNTHKRYAWASAAGAALNVGWIAIPLILGNRYGIYAMLYGFLLGHFLQAIALIPGLKGLYKYRFLLDLRNAAVMRALLMCIPIFISTLSVKINQAIDKALASILSAGSVTALGYATQLILLTNAIIAMPITTTFFTESSQAVQQRDISGLKKNISQFSTIMALILLPVTLLFMLLGNEIVSIVFMHGEFTKEAALLTEDAFLFYSPGVLPQALSLLLTRCFYSFGDTRRPLYASLAGVALNIALSFSLVGPMGISGLSLATSISALLITILLAITIKEHTGKLNILPWLKSCWKMALAGIGLGIVVALLKTLQIENYYIRFILCALAGTSAYVIILLLFKQEEARQLLNTVYTKARELIENRRNANPDGK